MPTRDQVQYIPDPNLDPLIRLMSLFLQGGWNAPQLGYPGALSPAFNPLMGQASSMLQGLAGSPYGMDMNPAAMGATNTFSRFANRGNMWVNPRTAQGGVGSNPYLAAMFGGGGGMPPRPGGGGMPPMGGGGYGGGMGPWGPGLRGPAGGYGPPPNLPRGGWMPPQVPPRYEWVYDPEQKKYVSREWNPENWPTGIEGTPAEQWHDPNFWSNFWADWWAQGGS